MTYSRANGQPFLIKWQQIISFSQTETSNKKQMQKQQVKKKKTRSTYLQYQHKETKSYISKTNTG